MICKRVSLSSSILMSNSWKREERDDESCVRICAKNRKPTKRLMCETAVQQSIIQFFNSDLGDRVQSVLQRRNLLSVLDNLPFQVLSFLPCHHGKL